MEMWGLVIISLGAMWSWIDFEQGRDITNLKWRCFTLEVLELALEAVLLIGLIFWLETFDWIRAFTSFDLLFMCIAVLSVEVWRKRGFAFWVSLWVIVFAFRQTAELEWDRAVLFDILSAIFQITLFRLFMRGMHLKISLSHESPRLGKTCFYLTALVLVSLIYTLSLKALPAAFF